MTVDEKTNALIIDTEERLRQLSSRREDAVKWEVFSRSEVKDTVLGMLNARLRATVEAYGKIDPADTSAMFKLSKLQVAQGELQFFINTISQATYELKSIDDAIRVSKDRLLTLVKDKTKESGLR